MKSKQSPTMPFINDSTLGASIFFLSTAISFAVYVSTASRSIAGGDAGELVAEGCQLGTSHPPGYPLYTIIIYMVTTLYPELTPAYLANIMSCVFGSISSGLISLVVYRLTEERNLEQDALVSNASRGSAALSASLMSAFSPLMWQYNTSAEVFALHNLFVSSIVFMLVIFSSKPNSAITIALGSFLCGLALTNQHTSILLVLPVAAFVCVKSSMMDKPNLLGLSSISFIVGISLYGLLPFLAIHRPHAGSWGDVTTLSGFIHHFLRRDYGTLQLYSGNDTASEGPGARTFSWVEDFVTHQLCRSSLVFLLFIAVFVCGLCLTDITSNNMGMKKNKRKRKRDHHREAENDPSGKVWKLILFCLVFYLGVFHTLSNLPLSNPLLYGVHQRFWMHPNILVFVLLGMGIQKSIARASQSSGLRLFVLSAIVLCLPYATYRGNFSSSDQSNNNYFRKYASSILETLPSNSLLLINYDQQWTSVRYMQECEGVRKDVTSINLSMMTFEWWKSKHALYENVDFPGTHYTRGNSLPWLNGGFSFSEFIDTNINNFGSNIFVGGRINFEDPAYNEKYEEEPFGLVRRIQRKKNTTASAESYRLDSLQIWRTISNHLAADLPCETKYPQTTWEWTIRREFFDHMVSRSTHLLDLALKDNKGSVLPSIAEATAWLELAGSWDSDTFARQSSMKKNIGLGYMNIVRSKESGSYPLVEDIFDDGLNKTDSESGAKLHRTNWWAEVSNVADNKNDWKAWATTRWREEWESFLGLESSKAEPGYVQIKNIYDAVINSASSRR